MMYKSQKKHQTIQLNLKNIKERGTKVGFLSNRTDKVIYEHQS